jgi:hypothetical protein
MPFKGDAFTRLWILPSGPVPNPDPNKFQTIEFKQVQIKVSTFQHLKFQIMTKLLRHISQRYDE